MGWGFLAKGKVTNQNIDKMERKISIKGVQYTMKHCVRARMMHESISGKMWSLDTMSDQYIYFYSCILAGTKNVKLEFDEFLNIMDENRSAEGVPGVRLRRSEGRGSLPEAQEG